MRGIRVRADYSEGDYSEADLCSAWRRGQGCRDLNARMACDDLNARMVCVDLNARMACDDLRESSRSPFPDLVAVQVQVSNVGVRRQGLGGRARVWARVWARAMRNLGRVNVTPA